MIRLSIRRKIMGIAVALIVLMTITAILSMVWVIEVGYRLQELTNSYIPAYGDLARTNIRSLERALALRRMVIERRKICGPPQHDRRQKRGGRAGSSGRARIDQWPYRER